MSDRAFLDTNVLVYSYDTGSPSKQQRAWDVIRSESDLVISTQVLQEFYVAVTRKLARPLAEDDAEHAVIDLLEFPIVEVAPHMVASAARTSRLRRLSFWDALIIEAATFAKCDRLLTEDLQHGLAIGQLRVVNPFLEG